MWLWGQQEEGTGVVHRDMLRVKGIREVPKNRQKYIYTQYYYSYLSKNSLARA